MLNQFSRTQLLLGEDGMKKLANARVAVFGIGGVGGQGVPHQSQPPDHCNPQNSRQIQDRSHERAYAGD